MDNKIYNLSEMTSKIANHQVQAVDSMVAKYLEEVVKHITQRGDKIEDYTLALVHNPMEFKNNGLKISMQYRVCRIDELQNLPIYKD